MRCNDRLGILLLIAVFLTGCSQPEESQQASSSADEATQSAEEVAAAGGEMSEVEPAVKPETEKAVSPGDAYLHINSKKPGVQVTASGLQFEILEQGNGKSPGPTSTVLTHYHGTLTSGKVFDSSVERGEPLEFALNRVIAGWTEALQMMKEGDKWRLVLPPEIAYGERGAGGGVIPPNAVLIFEVELIEVKD